MRVLKILLCALLLALPVLAEEAEDRQTATSLHYVSHELDTRQDKLTAGTNAALTYTNSAGGVEQRTVKENLNGGTTDTSLPQVNAVNAGLGTKQDDITTIDDHTAVTYTGQTGQIGQKGIYQTDGTYATQTNALIDAKTFNAALKNGLDNEFVCADRPDAYSPTGECWLWQIHNGATRLLPPGYTQLEWIESTGEQWIDTGIIPKTFDYDIETVFAFEEFGGTSPKCAWGFMGSSNLPRWLLCTFSNTYLLNANTTANIITAPDTNKHTFLGRVYYNDDIPVWSSTLDGVIQQNNRTIESYTTFTQNTLSIYLFARNNFNTVGNPVKGKLYRHTVKKAGVVIQDLVPAKNSSNIIGLYDLTDSNPATAFHTNQGSGFFAAGPVTNTNIYIPQNQQ